MNIYCLPASLILILTRKLRFRGYYRAQATQPVPGGVSDQIPSTDLLKPLWVRLGTGPAFQIPKIT